jgi:pimeloyl-ACP methyl ester carboxylesterase
VPAASSISSSQPSEPAGFVLDGPTLPDVAPSAGSCTGRAKEPSPPGGRARPLNKRGTAILAGNPLQRISAAFATLTGRAHRLRSHEEAARLTPHSREFPEEETAVDQFSEGARDQFSLALRMVAIEDHASGGTVLPFIGDNIWRASTTAAPQPPSTRLDAPLALLHKAEGGESWTRQSAALEWTALALPWKIVPSRQQRRQRPCSRDRNSTLPGAPGTGLAAKTPPPSKPHCWTTCSEQPSNRSTEKRAMTRSINNHGMARRVFLASSLAIATAEAGTAAEPQANGQHAALAGVKLWYTDTGGTGVPLILLHANTGTSAIWEHQVAAFSSAGFRVITFDRRGWGRSLADPASGAQPGTVAGDLDMLADHLGLARFHLLGVAGGGFVALDYASWRPERMLSLVIGASYGQFSEPEIQTFFNRLNTEDFKRVPGVLREVGPTYRGTAPEGTARWVEIEHHARQPGAPAQPLRTPNTYAKIAAISCPVLVLAAGADLYAPPALMRLWAVHLPRHVWDVVHDAGHAINWEQPEAFNAKVLAFLRNL